MINAEKKQKQKSKNLIQKTTKQIGFKRINPKK